MERTFIRGLFYIRTDFFISFDNSFGKIVDKKEWWLTTDEMLWKFNFHFVNDSLVLFMQKGTTYLAKVCHFFTTISMTWLNAKHRRMLLLLDHFSDRNSSRNIFNKRKSFVILPYKRECRKSFLIHLRKISFTRTGCERWKVKRERHFGEYDYEWPGIIETKKQTSALVH